MCAVVGVIQHKPSQTIAPHIYTALLHLKHRGTDSAGMVVGRQDGTVKEHKGLGGLDKVFFRTREDFRKSEWEGLCGIGHVRYATSGVDFLNPASVEQAKEAAQPLRGSFRGDDFFMSYNGNLVPSCVAALSSSLYGREISRTPHHSTQVDSQLIMRSLEFSPEETFERALFSTVHRWYGAFSMAFLYRNTLYALRDPWGFRPLELGLFENGYLVASESNVFDDTKLPGARFLKSIEPGQCVILASGSDAMQTKTYARFLPKPQHCAFEDIYFLRPDSFTSTEERVALYRARLGCILAKEQPPPNNADLVLGVPDSGMHAARGYAEETRLPYVPEALFRIHGAERSFMEPANDLRQKGIELKLSVIPEYLDGKVVVVVDDSIVRGNVSPRVVYLLKHHGAREVHMRVSSPPTIAPCYYGIDTWRITEELIARRHDGDVPAILAALNAILSGRYQKGEKGYILDSLGFLSLPGLMSAYESPGDMCFSCWSNRYPVL